MANEHRLTAAHTAPQINAVVTNFNLTLKGEFTLIDTPLK
jgi:hypothetical protein